MVHEDNLNSVERLIAIYHRLRNEESLTAAKLAEMFNVSTRTIYRDIKKMKRAGVEIYSYYEGYKLIN